MGDAFIFLIITIIVHVCVGCVCLNIYDNEIYVTHLNTIAANYLPV